MKEDHRPAAGKKSKNLIEPNPYNLLRRPRRVPCLTVLIQAQDEKEAREREG